jgi:hypothetical protein
MVRSCGKEHLERRLEAGGPLRGADMVGAPMVMPDGRLIAGEVMGGVALPITTLQGGGGGSGVLVRVKVDSAHRDVMHSNRLTGI